MDIPEHIDWATKEGDTEHVSIRTFAEKFNYTDRQTAEEAFINIINSSKLNKARRQRLQKSFATFKANAAEAYWTKRSCVNQAGIITTIAAVDSIKAGHRQSKISNEGPEVSSSQLLRTPSWHSETEVASPSPVSTPLLLREEIPFSSSPPSAQRHEKSDTEACSPGYSDYVDPTTDLEHYRVLNQELTWIVESVDLVEQFRSFRPQHLHDFSLARDGIADMRHGSQFRTSLAPHIAAAAGKVEPITTNIYEKWPTLEGILTRVFAKSHYEDVSKAVRDEDLHDPVVGLNYFTFHDEIPSDLNEREGFMDLVWAFIRGAMTLARIETRSLEILITGLYLSEASTIHNPKADKCVRDEFKLARAMRDSWISQIRSICRETVPRRGMAVFGSSSFKDETKLWRLDFNGVFRLMQFDAFLVPLKKQEFGIKAKAAVTRCMGLALRIEEEIETRLANAPIVDYEERIKLEDAASAIESTTVSPSKSRTKRRWSETI
ncbi:hypothetical protein EDD11_002503 [Mortierella claussenii]|nr:hypothetical protein EDD11_002503 [Mortierella claussenii]